MSLTYGLRSPRDLFEKLKRDAVLLGELVTSDRFFNFVITAYSLVDWVKNDASCPPSARSAVTAMYEDPVVQVCRDLANGSKHFVLDPNSSSYKKRPPVTAEAEARQGWGCGRWGKGSWGNFEEEIRIELKDGRSLECLELVEQVVGTWERFFVANAL